MGMVMINCPDSGHEIPTGLEMEGAAFKRAPVFFARVRCPACGREHEWFAKDAWVSDTWVNESWVSETWVSKTWTVETFDANPRAARPQRAGRA